MSVNRITLALLFFICLVSCDQSENNKTIDYPITPVPFTDVQIDDDFWGPRILKNAEVTIPIAFKQSEETGRIKNFEVAGGLTEGTFCTQYAFDDSDVFKIMEGAAFSLMVKPDPELEDYLDSLINKVAAAQEKDGYLYTNRTILGDSAYEMAGRERWSQVSEHSHELYNVGHMYEAAVAHYQATGKKNFLEIAVKNADLIDQEFGWDKLEKYPGHQEIEIGLVKLYRVTGKQRYLDLAKFFLDVRGPDGWEYNQAHIKPVDQREPIGHAVRALYMYSAMADIAALTSDTAYHYAIESIWNSLVEKKIYITGGVGQASGNEGFGPDYELPNLTAYCETCASIANVFWNQRMFLLNGDSKYIDVMERTMYSALLSGVSVEGNLFFYPNKLESDGSDRRQEWFGCACCPSNISRFLPSVPGYIYALKDDHIYINLFISSEAILKTPKGEIQINQFSDYPFDGKIKIVLNPEKTMDQKLFIRYPGWARNLPIASNLYRFYGMEDSKPIIIVNDNEVEYQIEKGYMVIKKNWKVNDQIEVIFEMPVRRILANDAVKNDKGRFALQRGPLVYCLEDADQQIAGVRHILSDIDGEFTIRNVSNLFGGITTLSFDAHIVKKDANGFVKTTKLPKQVKAIPYAYWANRDPGQMLVWIPYLEEFSYPFKSK